MEFLQILLDKVKNKSIIKFRIIIKLVWNTGSKSMEIQAAVFTNEKLGQRLRNAGIRPSSARIHVLRYLEAERNHPTVDQIYKALQPGLPSLSRASVYNTLSALERGGLVRPLTISGSELRYDAFVADHGHFCCRGCGTVYDFDRAAHAALPRGLEGFLVERQDLLAWGLCPDCQRPKA
jgi:Fe2+ or Zn2+ uptake regulation protein